MLACKRGHEEVVRVLLTAGAELHQKDSRGRTARDTASKRSHETILAMLNPSKQMRLMQVGSRGISLQKFSNPWNYASAKSVRFDSRPVTGMALVKYRYYRGHRPVCDRLCKCFRSQVFIALGRDNSDMSDSSNTCAEMELNHLVLHQTANPCATTPICAIAPMCAMTPMITVLGAIRRQYSVEQQQYRAR